MRWPVIIYHGLPDLGSATFQRYMQVQGYTSILAQFPADLFDAVSHYSESVVILAMNAPITRSLQLAHELNTYAETQGKRLGRIFVLADQATPSSTSDTEVIVPPFPLKQVAIRIEAFSKELA